MSVGIFILGAIILMLAKVKILKSLRALPANVCTFLCFRKVDKADASAVDGVAKKEKVEREATP